MDTAQQIKYAQLDLLTELRRICDKHGIGYFLVEGTLLGAIRHEGFIPWDDDIDVGMLRPDYEAFRKACAQELDPAYCLLDWHKDPHSPLPFLKLKIKGTHYREAVSAESQMDDAMFIDIFPFDNAPESPKARAKQEKKLYWLRKILLVRCNFRIHGGSFGKKLLYGALKLVSRVHSVAWWKARCEAELTRYNGEQTDFVTNMCSAYRYEKETFSRKQLVPVPHRFEQRDFSVPTAYDAVLRQIYGDYMQLPPEEKRVGRHDVVNVDFGSYRIRCVKE